MVNFNIKYSLKSKIVQQLIQATHKIALREKAMWIRKELISSQHGLKSLGWAEFILVLSQKFHVLILIGKNLSAVSEHEKKIDIGLTFDVKDIRNFCDRLHDGYELSSHRLTEINHACRHIKDNDDKIQSELLLKILQVISNDLSNALPEIASEVSTLTDENSYTSVSICQPIENALQQQIKQEQLLYRVTTQIRKSLELPVILSTAVEEVRRCLDVDRLLIYELQPNHISENSEPSVKENSQLTSELTSADKKLSNNFWGCTTYESRSSSEIPSILELDVENNLIDHLEFNNSELNQFCLTINDINAAYKKQNNLLNFLQKAQVKSELLLPIVVEEKLWGMLIAHQCMKLRQWQDNDRQFLGDIAEHLAIAIRQALLYRQLQEQKQILEERFKHQTQNLRDALIAAESANRSKSEFLAAMSHELRTPLTCVIGMSSTLLRWSFGQLSDKQRSYLKTIHDSGEHLLELINDILELSQLEAGKAVLNLQEISLIQLAEQMLASMREKARDAEISLHKDFQIAPEGDLLIADLRRMKQILYNLLSNAIKFTPTGGQVTVRIWREAETIILQVEDTGVGIPLEHQPLIFNKFQQLDASYHRNYEGTGLGLALTKQLIELHGGWISVTSQVGVGSIFTVELPIKEFNKNNASLHVSKPKINQSRSPGIVLIEEQEETATSLCNVLTNAGYQVVWMIDGSNALSNIEVLEPKLVIIDPPLSDINACDIIELLREKFSTTQLKILVLLTDIISESLTIFWEAGADDYLIKPIQSQSLLTKINSLLEN